jgi:hypothetical protein
MADISKIKLPDGTIHDIKARKTICPIYTMYGSSYTCNYTYDELSTMFNNGYNVVPIIRTSTGVFRIVNGTVDITSDIVWYLQCADYDANVFYNLTINHNSNNTITRINNGYVTYQPKISDSDWVELTLQTTSTNPIGVQAYSSDYKPKYRKIGHVVELEGIVKVRSQVSASNADSTFKIGTLPSEFRPPRTIRFFCPGSGGTMEHWVLMIESNGAVTGGRYGTSSAVAITTSKALPFSVTFMV